MVALRALQRCDGGRCEMGPMRVQAWAGSPTMQLNHLLEGRPLAAQVGGSALAAHATCAVHEDGAPRQLSSMAVQPG